jgi:hypothetical protein
LAALVSLGIWYFALPKPVWYVDEAFYRHWGRIVRDASPPFRRFEALPPGKPPPNRYGFIISPNPPGLEPGEPGLPLRVIPELSRTREWGGALALALDPWMIFRRHQEPEPSRARIDSPEGGAGILALPGAEEDAVGAWVSQLIQERPGAFPRESPPWDAAAPALFQGRRFQQGAETYHWVDIWPLLERREPVWLYAPLSRIRELPPYRMGVLDATRFPEKEDWNIYGIQAEILWALPFGDEKQRKNLDRARAWLQRAQTQTVIANTIDWIPAHPQGTPYNTISWESQEAWINSSFVWTPSKN